MTEHRGVCCALPRGLLAVAVDADADGLLLPRGPLLAGALLAGALLLAGPAVDISACLALLAHRPALPTPGPCRRQGHPAAGRGGRFCWGKLTLFFSLERGLQLQSFISRLAIHPCNSDPPPDPPPGAPRKDRRLDPTQGEGVGVEVWGNGRGHWVRAGRVLRTRVRSLRILEKSPSVQLSALSAARLSRPLGNFAAAAGSE